MLLVLVAQQHLLVEVDVLLVDAQGGRLGEVELLVLQQQVVVDVEALVAGELLPEVDPQVVSQPVVEVEDVAEVQRVQPQLAGGLEGQVGVVPQADFRAVLAGVQPVEHAKVGDQGNPVLAELGLEPEAEAVAVDLDFVVEVVLELTVLDFGVGDRVEADGRLAGELGVELDLVVRGVVVLEKSWLGYSRPGACPAGSRRGRSSGGRAWGG